MKEPKKLIIKANQEMGIIEALKAFPDSTAFVFQLGLEAGNYDYYMKLSDPVFTPDDTKYVSVFSAMGFNRQRRKLWFGEFFVPRGKELKTINNKQFLEMLEETAELFKAGKLLLDTDTRTNLTNIGLVNG